MIIDGSPANFLFGQTSEAVLVLSLFFLILAWRSNFYRLRWILLMLLAVGIGGMFLQAYTTVVLEVTVGPSGRFDVRRFRALSRPTFTLLNGSHAPLDTSSHFLLINNSSRPLAIRTLTYSNSTFTFGGLGNNVSDQVADQVVLAHSVHPLARLPDNIGPGDRPPQTITVKNYELGAKRTWLTWADGHQSPIGVAPVPTIPAIPTIPAPFVLTPTSAPPASLQPVSDPGTGALQGGRRRNAIAPLKIETESGVNYLVKFVSTNNNKTPLLIYIRGGETYSTKIPLGQYYIRAATGSTWYGRKDLFGPNTRFFRLRNKDGQQQTFLFYRSNNNVYGMTLSFKKVAEGNMQEETISRSEF